MATVDESERTDYRFEEEERAPRTVTVVKTEHGFGFNVRGQVAEGGQLKSISGQLYAPMQYISAVMKEGPAEKAGLNVGDRIIEVNGEVVEGADHSTVVQLIRQSGKQVVLSIISVSDEEARRLEPDTSSSSSTPGVEYYERRSVPVSLPETEKLSENGKEYVVYCIHMAGKKVCAHRYREFDALNNNLKRQFSDFIFPKLPGKWPFSLNDVQIDGRRRGLEDYIDKVCSAKVIFESDLLQDFLCLQDGGASLVESPSPTVTKAAPPLVDKVKLMVQLPDESQKSYSIPENFHTPDLLDVVMSDLEIDRQWRKYFGLFTCSGDKFMFKVTDSEYPYQVYQQIKDDLSTGQTCFFLRKWLFSPSYEAELLEDDKVSDLLYQQAVFDMANGLIDTESDDAHLRMLKAKGKKEEFLDALHKLSGYNNILFPHCKSDARKTGNIIMSIGVSGIALRACSEEGVKEKQEHSFTWDMVTTYEADVEEQAFTFQCVREGKEPRWIRVYSPQYLYMERCAARVKEEMKWKKTDASTGFMNSDDDL